MNHPEDILNQGLLDNLPDYTIFKKKTPKMRRYASNSKKHITGWHFMFIKNNNPKINYKYWISLNGYIENNYIQSSPVLNAVNNIVYTENSMYYLSKPNLSLPHPLFDKNELFKFNTGFPSDWKDIICKQIFKIFGDVRIENIVSNHMGFFEKTYNKIFAEDQKDDLNINNNEEHQYDYKTKMEDNNVLEDEAICKVKNDKSAFLNNNKNLDNFIETITPPNISSDLQNDIFITKNISNIDNDINDKKNLLYKNDCMKRVNNEDIINNNKLLNDKSNCVAEKGASQETSAKKEEDNFELFLEESLNELYEKKEVEGDDKNTKDAQEQTILKIQTNKELSAHKKVENFDHINISCYESLNKTEERFEEKNKEFEQETENIYNLPENLLSNNNTFNNLIQKFNKKKYDKFQHKNKKSEIFEDDLFKNINFDPIDEKNVVTEIEPKNEKNSSNLKNNDKNTENFKKSSSEKDIFDDLFNFEEDAKLDLNEEISAYKTIDSKDKSDTSILYLSNVERGDVINEKSSASNSLDNLIEKVKDTNFDSSPHLLDQKSNTMERNNYSRAENNGSKIVEFDKFEKKENVSFLYKTKNDASLNVPNIQDGCFKKNSLISAKEHKPKNNHKVVVSPSKDEQLIYDNNLKNETVLKKDISESVNKYKHKNTNPLENESFSVEEKIPEKISLELIKDKKQIQDFNDAKNIQKNTNSPNSEKLIYQKSILNNEITQSFCKDVIDKESEISNHEDFVNIEKEMLINIIENKKTGKQTKKRKTRTSLRMPKNFKLSKKKESDFTL